MKLPLVTKELRFKQVRRDRRAIDRHERLDSSSAVLVNRARDNLLPRARIALDEHGVLVLGSAHDEMTHQLCLQRRADVLA